MAASLTLLKSPREKKGLDMEQNAFWLQISALKTLFSFHLNLQLQSLKGNEILPSQPVIGESGHHHFLCSSKGSLPQFGWSKSGTAWDRFPQPTAVQQNWCWDIKGTTRAASDKHSLCSSPCEQIERLSRATACEGRGAAMEDRGAGFLSALQSPATWLWQSHPGLLIDTVRQSCQVFPKVGIGLMVSAPPENLWVQTPCAWKGTCAACEKASHPEMWDTQIQQNAGPTKLSSNEHSFLRLKRKEKTKKNKIIKSGVSDNPKFKDYIPTCTHAKWIFSIFRCFLESLSPRKVQW